MIQLNSSNDIDVKSVIYEHMKAQCHQVYML